MRVIAGLLLLAALPALAQSPPGPAGLPAPDAPHDRFPSQIFISPMGEPFRAAEGEPYPVAVWFAQANTHHDGELTRAEFRADALRFFKLLDVNHDGIIDSHEIDRYENEVAPEVQSGWAGGGGGGGTGFSGGGGGHHGHGGGGGGGFGGGGGGHGGHERGDAADTNGGDTGDSSTSSPRPAREVPSGAGRFGLINSPEPVIATDVQLTRRISPEEFLAAANRRFDLLDPDDKGVLTLDTLPHTPAQDRGGGERHHHHSH